METLKRVYVRKERDNVTYSLSVQYDNGGDVYVNRDLLLKWAKERYEQSMTFVSGNLEVDQAVQLTWNRVLGKLESL